MISSRTTRPPFKLALLLCLCWLFWIDPDIGCVQADSSRATDQALPAVLPLDAAVRWALENNPELAALRQQHGIAAAAVHEQHSARREWSFSDIAWMFCQTRDRPGKRGLQYSLA